MSLGSSIPSQTETAEVAKVSEAVEKHAVDERGANAEVITSLPPPPAGLAGTSSASGKNFKLTVSNKAGYLCHVHVVAEWPVAPEVPYAIFTHPDNSALFRDIQRVGQRKVQKTEPGYKEVEVEQLGEIQVLWIHRTYSTWLHVIEDTRDAECLHITFSLIRSDVLAKFEGEWKLRPIRDPASGRVVGCHGELTQDVLPKGMPAFMARLPVLGGALRGISVRAVVRVMEDFNVALDKVVAGHAAGRSTEAVLRELCGSVSEAAHANGAVISFAFDPAEDEDEDENEEQLPPPPQQQQVGGMEGAKGSQAADAVAAALGDQQPNGSQPKAAEPSCDAQAEGVPESAASTGAQPKAADAAASEGAVGGGRPADVATVSTLPEVRQGASHPIALVAEAVAVATGGQ